MDEKATLLIFARTPVPGKTKTRLIPALGEQGAADLYIRLVEHTLEQAAKSRFSNIELWCTDTGNFFVSEIESRYSFSVKLQQGDGLGERMYHALEESLQYSDYAVLIGCDCPVISKDDLDRSLDVLQQGNDAVLGPSEDGGYYLIGMRQADPALFENIHWGGSNVTIETRRIMKVLGWKWKETDLLWDVDVPLDLPKLADTPIGLQQVISTC